MQDINKGFAILAVVLMLMGLIFNLYPGLPKLPGDINIDRPGIKIYIPATSAIIVTIILTLLVNLLRK